MDISGIKPTTRTIEIKHPGTGDPIGIRVKLVSMDDDRLVKVKRAILDERLRLESRNKSFKADDIEANTHKLLFNATLGWEWYDQPEVTNEAGDVTKEAVECPTFDGAVPEFNQRNFVRVVKELPWFAEQIQEELNERKDFFDNSKSN